MDSKKWSLYFISLGFLFITCSSAELLIQQVTEGRGREYNSSYSLETNLGMTTTSVLRDEPPSTKILTFTNFSVIFLYKSSVFEASGYKWSMILYASGNRNDSGTGYIALYVNIEDTESLPSGWEVKVDLKLFVHNPKLQKYLTVTDGKAKRYNNAKKQWGYTPLISLATFYNTSEGYIVDDTCSFGAEIFIVKPVQQREKFTIISNPPNNVFTWKILHFSSLEDKYYYSDEFLIGDRYWRLGFDPEGTGGALPIYLFAEGYRPNALPTSTYGAVYLRLKNQRTSNHKQIYSANWYSSMPGYMRGNKIILFTELNDASNGYLVKDSIIFEAEVVQASVANIVSA